MAMREFPFNIRNNVDWNQAFVIEDFDRVLQQLKPHDFGGEALRLELKGPIVNRVIPSAVALDASTANGRIVIGTDPTQGGFSINVPASAMTALAEGMYLGDLLDFGANGSITALFVVRLTVHQGETAPTPA